VRKYFAIFLSVCVLVSLVALTGCSLWGYDDDDDVIAPAASMTISGSVDIPGDGIGASNLRGAVTLASNLKAQAYTLAVGGTETPVGTAVDVSSADGSYTVTFTAAAGYYFVKITSADVATFKMLNVVGNLATTDTTTTANVTSETTAVALVVISNSTTELMDPTTVAAADVATTKTAIETAIAGDGDVESITPTVAATALALNKTTAGIVVGATEALTATITPTYATNVTWTSSAATIASVNATGVVRGVAAGVATITVAADGGLTATCLVTVSEVPVTGVTLNKNATTLTVGANETLTANVAPSNAADKTVEWTTSAVGIASVNNGVVTAVAPGVATITVTTTDGGFTANCLVTVAVQTTTNVSLQDTVSGRALSEVLIKITGVAADFTTTVTLPDANSKNWVLSKDADLTTTHGALILRAQADTNGTAVTLADGFTLFADFNALTFTTGLPTGAQVFILNQGTDPVSTVTQSNVL